MNAFTIIEIINANTIRVEPKWEFGLKNGQSIVGDTIQIRGIEVPESNHDVIISRLKKLLLNSDKSIYFKSPELIDTNDHENGVVSCSVYVSQTNITYYFPEFVYR